VWAHVTLGASGCAWREEGYKAGLLMWAATLGTGRVGYALLEGGIGHALLEGGTGCAWLEGGTGQGWPLTPWARQLLRRKGSASRRGAKGPPPESAASQLEGKSRPPAMSRKAQSTEGMPIAPTHIHLRPAALGTPLQRRFGVLCCPLLAAPTSAFSPPPAPASAWAGTGTGPWMGHWQTA